MHESNLTKVVSHLDKEHHIMRISEQGEVEKLCGLKKRIEGHICTKDGSTLAVVLNTWMYSKKVCVIKNNVEVDLMDRFFRTERVSLKFSPNGQYLLVEGHNISIYRIDMDKCKHSYGSFLETGKADISDDIVAYSLKYTDMMVLYDLKDQKEYNIKVEGVDRISVQGCNALFFTRRQLVLISLSASKELTRMVFKRSPFVGTPLGAVFCERGGEVRHFDVFCSDGSIARFSKNDQVMTVRLHQPIYMLSSQADVVTLAHKTEGQNLWIQSLKTGIHKNLTRRSILDVVGALDVLETLLPKSIANLIAAYAQQEFDFEVRPTALNFGSVIYDGRAFSYLNGKEVDVYDSLFRTSEIEQAMHQVHAHCSKRIAALMKQSMTQKDEHIDKSDALTSSITKFAITGTYILAQIEDLLVLYDVKNRVFGEYQNVRTFDCYKNHLLMLGKRLVVVALDSGELIQQVTDKIQGEEILLDRFGSTTFTRGVVRRFDFKGRFLGNLFTHNPRHQARITAPEGRIKFGALEFEPIIKNIQFAKSDRDSIVIVSRDGGHCRIKL